MNINTLTLMISNFDQTCCRTTSSSITDIVPVFLLSLATIVGGAVLKLNSSGVKFSSNHLTKMTTDKKAWRPMIVPGGLTSSRQNPVDQKSVSEVHQQKQGVLYVGYAV
jgi:hypothetical protein